MYIWLEEYQVELLVETEYSRQGPRYYKEVYYHVQPSYRDYIQYGKKVSYAPFRFKDQTIIPCCNSELR